jgi:hypothetical protein
MRDFQSRAKTRGKVTRFAASQAGVGNSAFPAAANQRSNAGADSGGAPLPQLIRSFVMKEREF